MINGSFLLGFVYGKYGYEEFKLWHESAKEHEYLAGMIDFVYTDDYDEELYRKALEIVCELINGSEHHLKRFNDFLNSEFNS